MANYCSNCGKKLEATAAFCPECGQNISAPPLQYMNMGYNQYGQYGFQPGPKPENIIQAFKWTTYTGRINRKKYLLRGAALALVSIIIYLIALTIATHGMHYDYSTGKLIAFFAALPLSCLSMCNSIKRAHDLNKPALLPLICIVPTWLNALIHNKGLGIIAILVSGVVGFYLAFFKGTAGSNQYGDDPLMYS